MKKSDRHRMNQLNTAIFFSFILMIMGCNKKPQIKQDNSMVFQYSTINALAEGLYSSDYSINNLIQHGKYGLGTIEDLDGEMIGIDGAFFVIRANGIIEEMNGHESTPFAAVTDITNPVCFNLSNLANYETLKDSLSTRLSSRNLIFCIVLNGEFKNIKTRSIPKTKPNTRLIEVIPHQTIFWRKEPTRGTLVGFYFPEYMKDLNVVGFHFHFLSEDRKFGGHVLEIGTQNAKVDLQESSGFKLKVPETEEFRNVNLMRIDQTELDTIEN